MPAQRIIQILSKFKNYFNIWKKIAKFQKKYVLSKSFKINEKD